MELHSDFTKRIVVRVEDYNWVDSPMSGVQRMMLDRIGDEVARATSIVQYQPHSSFNSHVHVGGEEFFVLDGVFEDEHGTYPKGTYVRNPIGTSHTPTMGAQGATIFVKLCQFDPLDHEKKSIDTVNVDWRPGVVAGLEVLPLHSFNGENVALVKWAPNTIFQSHQHWGGEEIIVLEGVLHDEYGSYAEGTWLRNPHLSSHTPYVKEEGATILVKTGHLPE